MVGLEVCLDRLQERHLVLVKDLAELLKHQFWCLTDHLDGIVAAACHAYMAPCECKASCLLQVKWTRNQVVDKLEGEKLPPEVGFS